MHSVLDIWPRGQRSQMSSSPDTWAEVKGHTAQGRIRIPKEGRWDHNNIKLLHFFSYCRLVVIKEIVTCIRYYFTFQNQIQELKQAQNTSTAQLRTMLLDPAINIMFQRMKKEMDAGKEKLEQAQNDLAAWKFTPDRFVSVISLTEKILLCSGSFLRN